jgi:hypothetical protein
MLKNLPRYWQIRSSQLLSNATVTDYSLILLLICLLYFEKSYHLIGRIVTGWTIQSPGVGILMIINVGLLIGALGLWAMLLWRRLPFWLAVGLIVLTLWWLTTSPIISTLTGNIAGPEMYPQLLVTLVGLGIFGAISSLAQMAVSYQSRRPSQFWLTLSRKTPLPSFSGLGSLMMMGILRVIRDRFFFAILTLFVLTLVAKSNGGLMFGSWLTIVFGGMMVLSVMIGNILGSMSSSLLGKFPGLPTTSGAIDFAGGIAGGATMTVISWAILFALVQLNVVDTLWLTGIFLIGQICTLLIARSAREHKELGLLGGWWVVIIQLASLVVIYQILWQLNLSGVLLVLLIGLALFVALTSYQESPHSATISK